MLSIGIIGCGKIAQVRHIPEYAQNPRAKVVAFCDRTSERAEEMAKRYGGQAYENYQDLLSDSQIEAVSVCVANHLHAQVTMDALRAGKHVLVEKPMATTMEDCEAMVAEAERAGKKLLVGHNQLLTPAHKKAKQLLEQGVMGKILTFRTTFGHGGPENWSITPGPNTWFFHKQAAVLGAIADLGVHKIYLIQYLTGQRITEVTARLATLDKRNSRGEIIAVDDNALCIYAMENGIMGTMAASWTYYGREDNSTILYGTKGIMRIYEDPTYSIVVDLNAGETLRYDVERIQTYEQQTKSGVIDLFIETILDGQASDLTGQKALDTMRAIFASVESSRTQRTIIL